LLVIAGHLSSGARPEDHRPSVAPPTVRYRSHVARRADTAPAVPPHRRQPRRIPLAGAWAPCTEFALSLVPTRGPVCPNLNRHVGSPPSPPTDRPSTATYSFAQRRQAGREAARQEGCWIGSWVIRSGSVIGNIYNAPARNPADNLPQCDPAESPTRPSDHPHFASETVGMRPQPENAMRATRSLSGAKRSHRLGPIGNTRQNPAAAVAAR
jgi:hypothetical protein